MPQSISAKVNTKGHQSIYYIRVQFLEDSSNLTKVPDILKKIRILISQIFICMKIVAIAEA